MDNPLGINSNRTKDKFELLKYYFDISRALSIILSGGIEYEISIWRFNRISFENRFS